MVLFFQEQLFLEIFFIISLIYQTYGTRSALNYTMQSTTKVMSLRDMDVGLFVSYEVSDEALTTKLFGIFPLHTIPLTQLTDLREADETDVTKLNRLNWLSRRRLSPIYTLQTSVKAPRIFMRLTYGSHMELRKTLGTIH